MKSAMLSTTMPYVNLLHGTCLLWQSPCGLLLTLAFRRCLCWSSAFSKLRVKSIHDLAQRILFFSSVWNAYPGNVEIRPPLQGRLVSTNFSAFHLVLVSCNVCHALTCFFSSPLSSLHAPPIALLCLANKSLYYVDGSVLIGQYIALVRRYQGYLISGCQLCY